MRVRHATAGPTIMAVVKAFYEGRACKQHNAKTDGKTYWLFGHEIAKRNPDYKEHEAVAAKLCGERYEPRLRFTFAGWATPTTQRHLCALGVDAYCGRKGVPAQMNGREVLAGAWYTPEELKMKPLWEPEKVVRHRQFVNATLPLFP